MTEIALSYLGTREVSADYRQALLRVARSMAAFGIAPSKLDSSSFNKWVASLPASKTTKANYVRMAKTLWAFAARKKLTRRMISEDLVKVKPLVKPPVAWTSEELRTLMNCASGQMGCFRSSGCPVSLFWQCWLLVGYETGLRQGDLHNLMGSQLRGNRLYIVHHKTGQPQGKLLSPNAVTLVRDMLKKSPDGTVFRWALGRKWFFLNFKKLLTAAGLEGSSKFIRRTGATYCEIKQRGSAKAFLGHLSEGLAMKFYVDATLLDDEIPTPPPFMQTDSRPLTPAS